MSDLFYVVLSLLFLAMTYGLIALCERLMQDNQ
jgi:hypothetical protein